MRYEDQGRTSEWNEGAFKAMRLHEIQENINTLRLDPLGITKGKFNYELLITAIDLLYGEGRSKYSPTEKKEVDELKKLAKEFSRVVNPAKNLKEVGFGTTKYAVHYDDTLLNELFELIDLYEYKVKDLNDKHGLTTANRDADIGL